MNEDQPPQKPPPAWAKRPLYQLDYASPPANPPSGWRQALKIILLAVKIVLLVIIGLFGLLVLAIGMCFVQCALNRLHGMH